ncbi:MAG: hypothetical protein AAB281_03510, partial [Actinomycetota bacterium]
MSGGTISRDQTICAGGDPAAFSNTTSSTGSGTLTYQWQSSTSGCGGTFSNIPGATSETYNPPSGLNQSTYYRRVTASNLNGVVCIANGNCVTVTVNAVNPGATPGNNQTIALGADPVAFVSGVGGSGSGSITYQWQSNTSGCGGGFSDITGATAITYDPPTGLTQTTYYQRLTISTLNGVACSAGADCIILTLNGVEGGAIGGDQTICPGGDPASLPNVLGGSGDGAISYQWQSSTTGCSGGFSNIAGTNAAMYNPPAGLTQTTYYRRVTTSTLNGVPYSANSNCVIVTVNTVNSGGVGNDQAVCTAGDPLAFVNTASGSGSGGTASYQWQQNTSSCA